MLSTSFRERPSPCCVAELENEQTVNDFLATAAKASRPVWLRLSLHATILPC